MYLQQHNHKSMVLRADLKQTEGKDRHVHLNKKLVKELFFKIMLFVYCKHLIGKIRKRDPRWNAYCY